MSPPAIAVHDAGVQRGGRFVWRHLDVEIDRGELAAVVGPNGAGKSTFLLAVLGLLPLAEGRVEVLGSPVGASNRRVGYLPQRRSFDGGVRIRGVDLVHLGVDGDRWGVPLPFGRRRAAARTRVADALAVVGAEDFAARPLTDVSGGELQRLLIAQALVRSPDLLLLDEPLDSLDLPNQAAVAALVSALTRDHGVTVVVVTHDVNPLLGALDRVVYLGDGRCVTGRPSEVMTSETLSALFSSPIEVLRASDGRLVVVGQPEPPAVHADRHEHR